MHSGTGTLIRVLNNNAILVDAAGDRLILLGRGIGFGKHLGDCVDVNACSEVFAPSDALELRQFADFAREIPFEVFRVARAAIDQAPNQRKSANQALLLSIADHLNFALERARAGIKLDYPLRWEISQLYPAEMTLGQATVRLANELLRPSHPLGEEEATAFAMHFVNAQFVTGDLSRTVAMTQSLQRVVDVVTTSMGEAATSDATSVARFITHLRYLCARVAARTQISEAPPPLLTAVRDAYPDIAKVTDQVRAIIEEGGDRLSDAEICYLDIHLARLWTLSRQS